MSSLPRVKSFCRWDRPTRRDRGLPAGEVMSSRRWALDSRGGGSALGGKFVCGGTGHPGSAIRPRAVSDAIVRPGWARDIRRRSAQGWRSDARREDPIAGRELQHILAGRSDVRSGALRPWELIDDLF